ncbi:MotA/TolQ/ExbB proton channel family protein [Pseudoalteromonas sp. SR44-5]|uniref:MotA/TolQ/ExbB proton channel family protein n=1 Tax=Pseudoalteromonas sp. SR44-5 TaxID=2760934 RepID=UPI0016037D89|nr:MotA/TolQ/ExbB proton channel family protein [Pseudoalteromonas sp. SR44-5]MBB1369029.1 MotA/TolQ/ExbB proton channel family protein [Pseudoalteromonas sp. SR44-5]
MSPFGLISVTIMVLVLLCAIRAYVKAWRLPIISKHDLKTHADRKTFEDTLYLLDFVTTNSSTLGLFFTILGLCLSLSVESSQMRAAIGPALITTVIGAFANLLARNGKLQLRKKVV